jgi:hypothetical protein
MTSYTSPFSGQQIYPTTVSYEALSVTANTILQWPVNGNTNTPVSSIIDVVATANSSAPTVGWLLELPPAQQVSTGQSTLVRNVGSSLFTVTDTSGNTIVTIASGLAYYIFLTDNTTTNGTWSYVLFGAGTSSSNASALAGYGLMASGLTLNQVYPVLSYSTPTTLTAANSADLSVWTGGVGSFTLPSATAVGAGWFITIKNNGTGVLTITPSGTDTIDGNSNQQLQLTESISLVSTGLSSTSTVSSWNSFGYGRSNAFAYTLLALSVTGGTLTLSSTQASNTIQSYSGTLTSAQTIVVPSTVQLYTITNNTSGSYTFTVKTSVSGGASINVPQGSSLVLVCDGTNVYNAASGTGNSFTTLSVGNGSVSNPSIAFSAEATTGIYRPTTGQFGISVLNTAVGYFFNTTGSTGLNVTGTGTFTLGIGGGAF